MPDGLNALPAANQPVASSRSALVGFTMDATAEAALRKGLSDAVSGELDIRPIRLRAAIQQLSKMPTPQTLLVDVSGEGDPLGLLAELAQVLEPDVRVLVIGDQDDRDFYRKVTRELGAAEFLYKPLIPDAVARVFGTAIARRTPRRSAGGGMFVAVIGARGGAGATTVATNLAWHLAHNARRHTVVLDADLQMGSAALSLGVVCGSGLRVALEQPERVDELFVERSAQPVEDRLHMLGATEELNAKIVMASGAVATLLGALGRRYNTIIGDVPFRPMEFNQDLLDQAQQRVVVMQPTLASVREVLRLLALPVGSEQARRPILVLNRAGRPGGLTAAQVQHALGTTPDVVIPDMPRPIEAAATLGKPAAATVKPVAASIAKLAHEIAGTGEGDGPRRWRLFGRGR